MNSAGLLKYFPISLLLILTSAMAGEVVAGDPLHGGLIVEDSVDINRAEVVLGKKSDHVDVYLMHPVDHPPKDMSVTLFHEEGGPHTIELQAVGVPGELFPHYQGQLSPAEAPFIGIELRFTGDPAEPRILKSRDSLFFRERD